MRVLFRRLLPVLLLMAAVADPARAASPRVAIIIDDLGDRLDWGRQVLALPGALTLSFLPHTPYAERLAREAHASGKEVMLHLPMQAVSGAALGPGGITMEMDRGEITRSVLSGLSSVPHVRGVNNHMGSLLTRHTDHMGWLMQTLSARGDLYFVDSRTTIRTVARQVAHEHAVPSTQRDVFLDHSRDPAQIYNEFARLVEIARRNGAAVAIGHPYPETTAVLAEVLPLLKQADIALVHVSTLLESEQHQWRQKQWQASLSPSQTGAKSSRP